MRKVRGCDGARVRRCEGARVRGLKVGGSDGPRLVRGPKARWSTEGRYCDVMSRYDFLIDTYRTERIKTLSVWSQIPDDRMAFRPEPRARTPHEHMVHQCMSEDAWMTKMLGIASGLPVLPIEETKLIFLGHYATASAARLSALEAMDDAWFEGATQFFDTVRSRAWVLTRRLTHSAHHRGQ